MTDRILPHDSEAEKVLLGAILLRSSLFDDVAGVLKPEDFYHDHHQRIFRHMRALSAQSVPIDMLTLKDALRRAGELDTVGTSQLFALTDGMPHGTHVTSYAQIVRNKAVLREVILASQMAMEAAYDASDSAAEVLDGAQHALFQIASNATVGGLVPARQLAHELFGTLEKLSQNRSAVTGVPTGLQDLDFLTAGFQRGDLILIAARPSMGKTALALNMAMHAATVAQKHVAVFSLEMSREALGLRVVSSEAQVDSHRMRTGHIREAEWPRITNALQKFADAHLHIDDGSQLSIHSMRAGARKLKATVGLDLVMVDYLQLMEGKRSENRNLEMAGLTRALKMLAKDLDVPVVALSQLSRAPEQRAEKQPQLSDLRDSGAIEQDADVVIFIYREEQYSDDPAAQGMAELLVKKQRNGPIGTVRVAFDASTTTFRNLARV